MTQPETLTQPEKIRLAHAIGHVSDEPDFDHGTFLRKVADEVESIIRDRRAAVEVELTDAERQALADAAVIHLGDEVDVGDICDVVAEILKERRLDQPAIHVHDLQLPPGGDVRVTYWPKTHAEAVAIVRDIDGAWTTDRTSETLEAMRCAHDGVGITIYLSVPRKEPEVRTPAATAILAEAHGA